MAIQYNDRAPRSADSTPVILTIGTGLTLIPTASGRPGPTLTLPTADLTNTLQNPIEITELVISLFESGVQTGYNAGSTELSLSVGSKQITNGFVPVRALPVRRDTAGFEGDPNATGEGTPLAQVDTVRWIFPVPLIVAPNEGFSGMVRMSPVVASASVLANQNVTVLMTARGRRLPMGTPVPRVRAIPYASGWIFTTANTPAPDNVFRNNFQVPLHVTSINATTISWGTWAGSDGGPSGAMTMHSPGGLMPTALRTVISPIGQSAAAIFGYQSAIAEMHDLAPGEDHDISFSLPTTGVPVTWVLSCMVGWREE